MYVLLSTYPTERMMASNLKITNFILNSACDRGIAGEAEAEAAEGRNYKQE